ncbi:alcohol oxidase-like protein [Trametes elegans]|nr:alcohol oxidase-like protein [Trametes elegans]
MAQSTYDIIIAGGGAAGCVIAGRLAAADPTLSILVLESGPTTRDDPLHTQPARYLYHLRPESTTVRFNVARESAALAGRAPVVPSAQCLGGGSSINFAMYTRAAASDYDDWATVYRNKGWSCADLLPLLRKCETYQIQPGKPTHGYAGPLKVSFGGYFPEIGQEFLNTTSQYDKTRGITDDVNNLYECNKYGRWQKWIDSKTGTRSDVAHNYIYPHSANSNLHILTGYHVKKVVFSGNRATGVEFVVNPRLHPDTKTEVLTATARRLVVLSSGAFGSPAILERSGIGAKAVLAKVGVKQFVDLPGVGENYQDHQHFFPACVAADSAQTLDGIVTDDQVELEKWTKQWNANGSGMLANNGLDAGIKLRPFKDELDAIGDGFRKRWLEYYVPSPDKPVLWMATMSQFIGDRTNVPKGKYFSVGWFLMHPESVGYAHITSADDVDALQDFHTGMLDAPSDMALHKWGYKRTREIARRLPSFRGEVRSRHPAFSPASEAAVVERAEPTPLLAPELVYTKEDDEALEAYIRELVSTCWHSLGTCAMKRREEGGVVDSRLNVYGVEGLKVADLSICPGNVAGNTYSTAVVVGEKAATLIAEELGIPLEDFTTHLTAHL